MGGPKHRCRRCAGCSHRCTLGQHRQHPLRQTPSGWRLGLWRLPNIRTIPIPARWTLLGASMRGIAILISGTLLLLWLFGLLHGQADFVVLHANDFHLYFGIHRHVLINFQGFTHWIGSFNRNLTIKIHPWSQSLGQGNIQVFTNRNFCIDTPCHIHI